MPDLQTRTWGFWILYSHTALREALFFLALAATIHHRLTHAAFGVGYNYHKWYHWQCGSWMRPISPHRKHLWL